jgi:hypothetical protein
MGVLCKNQFFNGFFVLKKLFFGIFVFKNDVLDKKTLETKKSDSLELNFVHLELGLEDPGGHHTTSQDVLNITLLFLLEI